MEKTTVYVTAAQKAALARAGEAEGRSEASLIRAGIDAVTARHRVADPTAPLAHGEAAGPITPRHRAIVKPRWIAREEFIRRVVVAQADAGLRLELRDLAPDMTDDLSPP